VRRVDYSGDGLVESDVAATPYLQTRSWVDAAVAAAEFRADVPEPAALSVATVDATGTPDVRTVLMRFLDARGPGFVTNLGSTKSQHLRANPRVAASLTWPALSRAIRFRGTAELIGRDEVEAYFDSRPYGSRLSAWASDQSRPAADRHELERRWQEVLERFPDTGGDHDVPVPDFWGGWRIVCDEVEFWAGRRNRLHDRIVFRRTGDGDLADAGSWTRLRLQP
jgi:pyridoxamine 5'-phosphate oxidase